MLILPIPARPNRCRGIAGEGSAQRSPGLVPAVADGEVAGDRLAPLASRNGGAGGEQVKQLRGAQRSIAGRGKIAFEA